MLADFEIVKRVEQPDTPELGGPALILAYRPEVNGYVSVDVRNRKWPDHMGDATNEPALFVAWSTGNYGPYAFPGGLRRAQAQLWAWPDGKEVPDRHEAFIHVSTSYIFGANKEAPVVPADYAPLPEMRFVTRIVLALLKHSDALTYFNPNGEILADEKLMRKSLAYHDEHQLPPFNIWCNVRLQNANNGWMVMDTVGMEQLDRPDFEACFPRQTYDPQEISRFLRNCSLYLLDKGVVIKDGDTMDGPGNIRWQARHTTKELSPPPRRLIRWFPMDGSQPPDTTRPEGRKATPPGLIKRLFGKK